jgi:hypothetical protein
MKIWGFERWLRGKPTVTTKVRFGDVSLRIL